MHARSGDLIPSPALRRIWFLTTIDDGFAQELHRCLPYASIKLINALEPRLVANRVKQS